MYLCLYNSITMYINIVNTLIISFVLALLFKVRAGYVHTYIMQLIKVNTLYLLSPDWRETVVKFKLLCLIETKPNYI